MIILTQKKEKKTIQNIMKIIETFKEKIKSPLKKWRKRQTKMEKLINHSKKPKKTKKKESNRRRKHFKTWRLKGRQ